MISEVHEMICDVSKSLVREIMKEMLDCQKCLKTTKKKKLEWMLH